jgi:hypothetical protein
VALAHRHFDGHIEGVAEAQLLPQQLRHLLCELLDLLRILQELVELRLKLVVKGFSNPLAAVVVERAHPTDRVRLEVNLPTERVQRVPAAETGNDHRTQVGSELSPPIAMNSATDVVLPLKHNNVETELMGQTITIKGRTSV